LIGGDQTVIRAASAASRNDRRDGAPSQAAGAQALQFPQMDCNHPLKRHPLTAYLKIGGKAVSPNLNSALVHAWHARANTLRSGEANRSNLRHSAIASNCSRELYIDSFTPVHPRVQWKSLHRRDVENEAFEAEIEAVIKAPPDDAQYSIKDMGR
jgi:hypothetical protein